MRRLVSPVGKTAAAIGLLGLTLGLLSAGVSVRASDKDDKTLPASPPVVQNAAGAFQEYSLMPGTPFHILLQSPIDTAISHEGDPIDAVLMQNIYLNETLLLSKNTRFRGEITKLYPPVQGRNAVLEVRFTDILLDNGERLPIAAHVRTGHPEHIWGGTVTPGTVPKLSTQRVWGIGEYNRVIMQGPRAMGEHIVLTPGEPWTIILEQPVTLVQSEVQSGY